MLFPEEIPPVSPTRNILRQHGEGEKKFSCQICIYHVSSVFHYFMTIYTTGKTEWDEDSMRLHDEKETFMCLQFDFIQLIGTEACGPLEDRNQV